MVQTHQSRKTTQTAQVAQTTQTARRKTRGSRLLKDGTVPEATIQAQILAWLKEAEVLHWRQQSGKVFLGRRCINMGPEGLPDIVVIVPPNGRVLGLEVKSANGALRPSQKAFKAQLESVGGTFKVVRSLEQAMNALAEELGDEAWMRLQLSGGKMQRASQGLYGPN